MLSRVNAVTEKKESLKQSVGFSALEGVGTQVISLFGFIVLARLLSPHEFGLMALVAIFTSFASIFIEMGMGAALIHNQEATEEHYSTAFWFNMCLAIFCYSLLFIGSSWIAFYFQQPDLQIIIIVVGLLLPLNALAIVPMSILQKRQNFKQIAVVELFSSIVAVVVAVVVAYQGFGVWALVANLMIMALIKIGLLFYLLDWHPKWQFSEEKLGELWSYSGYLMGSSFVSYCVENADRLLIGKMLNTATLGLYDYALKLVLMPVTLIALVLNRVFFSEYSRLSSNIPKKRIIHLKLLRIVSFVIFPILIMIGQLSDLLVLSVLGEQWKGMIHILEMVSFIYLLRAIASLNGPIYLSEGKTKLLFKLTIFMRGNVFIATFLGIYLGGLEGLLWGLLIARVINFIPALYFPAKLLGITVKDYIHAMFGSIVSVALMYVSIYEVKQMVSYEHNSLLTFIIISLISAAIYLFYSFIFNKKTLMELLLIMNIRRVTCNR